MLGLVALMASCSEDFTDWANPQSTAEESATTVSLSLANASAIDFSKLTSDSVQLFVPTITSSKVVANSYTALLYNADKTQSVTLATDDKGQVTAAALKSAVETLYGKRPVARTIPITVTALSNDNGVSIKNVGETNATVTLVAPFIDSAYYLVGDFAGWDKATALQFNHSGSGDVYDNPEFTITVNIKATADKTSDWYWKIIPATNYNGTFWAEGTTGVVGTVTNGDASFSGNLTTTSPQAGKIAEPGIYRFTINMMDYSYKIEKLNFQEYAYEIGNESGWSTSHALYGPNFDGKYQGYYYLDGQFKFKPNADNWDDDLEYVSDGVLTKDGSNNVPDPGAGFYQINLDLASMSYSLVKVDNISLIGAFNGWGGDVDMTYNVANNTWEAKGVQLGGEFKFRMNHDWAISWGGTSSDTDFANLTANGGKNLNVATGTYDVTLSVSYEGKNSVVITPAASAAKKK